MKRRDLLIATALSPLMLSGISSSLFRKPSINIDGGTFPVKGARMQILSDDGEEWIDICELSELRLGDVS
jgi:hypothetical protein